TNKIFSRDRHYQRWTGGIVAVENFTGGGDGDFLGVEYYLTNTDTVNSISVYIDYRTTVGTTILGQVYLDAATPTLVIESEEFLIEEEHIGTWVTLAMVTINPGDDILAGGSNYYCGVECYASGEDLNIGTEGEAYPHLLHLEAKLRLGTTWYWIHELPYVRLNLAGATLPAYFTSEPELECGLENYYSYTAEVTDPQNLTVTLEAESTNTDVLLDFIDNGNGTIDITTGATPFDAGLVLDDRFRIRVMVDNGTVVNEQYFWVTVVPTIGIADADINNINIYPNPAQNVLFVENAKNARIYIYNLLGDVVTSIERADMLNQISLDKFAAGTYIISVVKDNEVITKKFNKI
ncbi:MAG: T9SS type A sorting domain-containing protein, partial [Bacteroidota bacterium]|nr:T9SS type A sorting domain-containing protein [Bacteroidota bacterium]